MLKQLEVLQDIFVASEPELAMLGDTVEIEYGFTTMIGTVVEGDPWLDSFGATWFNVVGFVNLRSTSLWVTDAAVIRIIR